MAGQHRPVQGFHNETYACVVGHSITFLHNKKSIMHSNKIIHVFRVEQQSKDFVPVSGTVVFEDNVEWDEEMVANAKQMIAEFYDCSISEIKHNKE